MLQSILPRCTLKTSFQCTKKNCFTLLLSTWHVSEELVLMCSSQILVMNKIDSHYFAKHPAIKEKSGWDSGSLYTHLCNAGQSIHSKETT